MFRVQSRRSVADSVSSQFDPPLPTLKRQAFAEKHVNQCLKVHSEISLPEYRSWTGNLCDDDGSPRELVSSVKRLSCAGTADLVPL